MGPPILHQQNAQTHSPNASSSMNTATDTNTNWTRMAINRRGRLGFSAPETIDIPRMDMDDSVGRRTISLADLFNSRQSSLAGIETSRNARPLIQEHFPAQDTFKVPIDEHPLKYITDTYLKEISDNERQSTTNASEPNNLVDATSASDTNRIMSRLDEWQHILRLPALSGQMSQPQAQSSDGVSMDVDGTPGDDAGTDPELRRSFTRRMRQRDYLDMFLRAYNDVMTDGSSNGTGLLQNLSQLTGQTINIQNYDRSPHQSSGSTMQNSGATLSRRTSDASLAQSAQQRVDSAATTRTSSQNTFHVRIPAWVCEEDRQSIVRTVNSVAGLIDSTIRAHQRSRQQQGLDPFDETALLTLSLEERAMEMFHVHSVGLSSASLVTYVENLIGQMTRAFRSHARTIGMNSGYQPGSTHDPTPQQRLTIYIIHERTSGGNQSANQSAGIRRQISQTLAADNAPPSTSYLSWRSRLNRLQQRLESAQDTFNSTRYTRINSFGDRESGSEESRSNPEIPLPPSRNNASLPVAGANRNVAEGREEHERSVRPRLVLEDDLE